MKENIYKQEINGSKVVNRNGHIQHTNKPIAATYIFIISGLFIHLFTNQTVTKDVLHARYNHCQ